MDGAKLEKYLSGKNGRHEFEMYIDLQLGVRLNI